MFGVKQDGHPAFDEAQLITNETKRNETKTKQNETTFRFVSFILSMVGNLRSILEGEAVFIQRHKFSKKEVCFLDV